METHKRFGMRTKDSTSLFVWRDEFSGSQRNFAGHSCAKRGTVELPKGSVASWSLSTDLDRHPPGSQVMKLNGQTLHTSWGSRNSTSWSPWRSSANVLTEIWDGRYGAEQYTFRKVSELHQQQLSKGCPGLRTSCFLLPIYCADNTFLLPTSYSVLPCKCYSLLPTSQRFPPGTSYLLLASLCYILLPLLPNGSWASSIHEFSLNR